MGGPGFFDYGFSFHKFGENQMALEGSDIDDSSAVQYFGYLANNGAWLIVKLDTGASPKTIRYAAGKSDYITNWGTGGTPMRTTLTYDYYHKVFPVYPG